MVFQQVTWTHFVLVFICSSMVYALACSFDNYKGGLWAFYPVLWLLICAVDNFRAANRKKRA
jgi:hypothetical protein